MAKANKHLDHLEDRIILEGSKGGDDSLKVLREMGKLLTGKGGNPIVVTTKWDGAPAVICGIDPEDGKFFVGTKGVFAKEPKIAKTQSEVQKLYSGGLVEKMSAALEYLPKSVKQGILQGDLMFTNDKKMESIDDKRFITFRPNTITYAVPVDSDMAKQVKKAKIGIVWHTTYSGKSMIDMKASFGANVSGLRKIKDVFFHMLEKTQRS